MQGVEMSVEELDYISDGETLHISQGMRYHSICLVHVPNMKIHNQVKILIRCQVSQSIRLRNCLEKEDLGELCSQPIVRQKKRLRLKSFMQVDSVKNLSFSTLA